MLRREPCHVHGDGETTRDFCFVANVVQANILAAVEPIGPSDQVYNVGLGSRTSLNDLYAVLRDGLARRAPELAGTVPVHDEFRPGDVRHSQADTTRIRDALGYEPTHTLAEGLEETLDWYIEQIGGKPAELAV
jgi:UDP-N-acetylglucosamine 4-epimerase